MGFVHEDAIRVRFWELVCLEGWSLNGRGGSAREPGRQRVGGVGVSAWTMRSTLARSAARPARCSGWRLGPVLEPGRAAGHRVRAPSWRQLRGDRQRVGAGQVGDLSRGAAQPLRGRRLLGGGGALQGRDGTSTTQGLQARRPAVVRPDRAVDGPRLVAAADRGDAAAERARAQQWPGEPRDDLPGAVRADPRPVAR